MKKELNYKTGLYIFFTVFAIGGAIFMLVGLSMFYKGYRLGIYGVEPDSYQVVGEKVSKGDDGTLYYKDIIVYEYQGKTYRNVELPKGESPIVDSKHPSRCGSKNDISGDNHLLGMIFPLLGLPFFLIGSIGLYVNLSKANKKKNLIEQGQCIYGVIDDVKMNMYVTVNETHPYNVFVSYTDPSTGTEHHFKSENFYNNDRTQYYDFYQIFPKGDRITVYVDPNNFKKYYVDIDSKLGEIIGEE